MLAANNPVAGVVAMSTPAVFMDNETQLKVGAIFLVVTAVAGQTGSG